MVLEKTYELRHAKGRRCEYKCPCGKGMVVEEFRGRMRYAYIDCPECEARYYLSSSHGHWTVKQKEAVICA